MPYIIGQVSEKKNGASSPCMNFQVQCLNKPYINRIITYAPPYFWVTVAKDEYVMQVISGTGAVATAVATALTDFGGVRLAVAIA